MSEGGASSGCVLVEAVGGVVICSIGIPRPLVTVIEPALARDFLHLVAGVGVGLILCGSGEVMGEAGKCTLGAVAIAGSGAVTQGYRGAPGEVVEGVGRQVDRTGFLDRRWTVERVISGGDVKRSFRPGELCAVACRVILVGQCLAAGRGTGQPSGIVIDVADGIAGFVGGSRAPQQVVGVGDVVCSDRIGAAEQPVEVVVEAIVMLWPLRLSGCYTRRMESKKSALFFVALILSRRNDIASISSIG